MVGENEPPETGPFAGRTLMPNGTESAEEFHVRFRAHWLERRDPLNPMGPGWDSWERLPTLVQLCRDSRIDEDRLRELLPDVWSLTNAPLAYVDADSLVAMFETAGFISDEDEAEKPTEPLTVYRGAHPAFRDGLAWTTSEGRAWFFACNYPDTLRTRMAIDHQVAGAPAPALGNPSEAFHVYRADVMPWGVLARFNGREEEEVVVNPEALDDLEDLGTVVPSHIQIGED